MRGPYHERLRGLLRDATTTGVCTQESLSGAIGKTQTGVGKYLLGKGGALDVDEAAAALQHIGSSLEDFLAGTPPQPLTPAERMARALGTRPELQGLVEDLLPVPKPRLAAVIELVRDVVPIATGRRGGRTGASRGGTVEATRTRRAARPRR